MTRAEAVTYLRRMIIDQRQRLVPPKVPTTPYIEALEMAIAELETGKVDP